MEALTKLSANDYYLFFGLAAIFALVYFSGRSFVNRSHMTNDHKRRAIANLRMAYIFGVLVSLILIWSTELYSAALSIAAFGAAFSIALKDVLTSIWGSFYLTLSHPFSIGDRIEVNSIRGDVVDIGLMTTQILEVGPKNMTHQYTGRTIFVPNSKFILDRFYNETRSAHEDDDYALHVFTVPTENSADWHRKRQCLIEASKSTCDKYIEEANRFFTELARIKKVDVPWVEPRVSTHVVSPTQLDFVVRVSIPVHSKGTIEQEIINSYLGKIHAEAKQ